MTIRAFAKLLVPPAVRRALRRVFPAPEPIAPEYSADYFRQIDEWQEASYPVIAKSVVDAFAPQSVIDVGCGGGRLLVELAKHGLRCTGIEHSDAGRELARSRGLDVRFGDLTRECAVGRELDLAVCVEVAEHLPPESADRLVENLASGPSLLIFSAAPPGQGGHLHLNEQPPEYWIEKFERRGFKLSRGETASLRQSWTLSGVVAWYSDNVMVFRREPVNGQPK